MLIGAVQMNATPGAIPENTAKMLSYVERAAGKQLDVVVFPEMADTGYDMKLIVQVATPWDDGAVPQLRQAARKHGINIVAGVSERAEGGVFNSLVVIDRQGQVAGRYRKTHLITAEPMVEHLFLKSGGELGRTTIENVPCGLMTCYDIRFPEVSRSLSIEGAKILFVPSAFPLVRLPHWTTLVTARAIENQVFVVACNRVGADAGVPFCGTSMVVDPYGVTVASGSDIHESLIVADINLEMISTVRSQIKVHQDRRPDLYRLAG